MAKQRGAPLSATFVRTVKRPGRYGDGRGGFGLSLLVKNQTNGRLSKSWSQRCRIGGREFNIGLGAYPIVTLADAREKALDNRRLIAKGGDPRTGTDRTPTFQAAAEKVIALHRKGWKNPDRIAGQWEQSLRDNVFPRIGSMSVSKVAAADVLRCLKPIWHSKPTVAQAVKQRVSAVLKWAAAQGYRTDDPTPAAVAGLPKQNRRVKHHDALPHGEVAKAIAMFDASNVQRTTALAFKWIVLTACRMSEAIQAQWDEIDMDAATWTVPATRSKTKKEHRVPLSTAALAVLAESPTSTGLIFPARNGSMSRHLIGKTMKRLGITGTPHGMRSAFRDWCSENGVRREAAEMALAHVVKGVEGAYRRTDLIDERRDIMQAWADYCA